ncbi:hypothetical protein B0H13DRAFT_1917062 [Mycena leptocephala]|nr:hypothetical protein B0H13DRAFT_1917062 [Mycena leptocephala]
MADRSVVEILEERELRPFHAQDWIGKNLTYPSSLPPELDVYCARQLSIPPAMTGSFPNDALSVTETLRVQLPGRSHALVFPVATTCFSHLTPTTSTTKVIAYLQKTTLPPAKHIACLKAEVGQAILDGKKSVLDSRYLNMCLPLWIIPVWEWLRQMVEAQEEWKMAQILSSLGWNTPLQSLPRDTTHCFTHIIADKMVSDGGLDMMILLLQRRISEEPRIASKVLLVQRPFIFNILKATTADDYKEEKKGGLQKLEKKLKEANMSELWFAALWEEQKHWLPFKFMVSHS